MLKQYKNPVIYAQNLDKKISEDYILVIRKQQKLFSKDKTEVIGYRKAAKMCSRNEEYYD